MTEEIRDTAFSGEREPALPEDPSYIIRKLEENGFEAYAVGGCVRDLMLGREPKDFDITTSARPKEIKKVFRNTVDTGIQHGTVTVVLRGGAYEVTTYRVDGIYEDGRHPKEVTFSESLKEDLARRDFTINAMAYHPRRGIVDIFGGEKDLRMGVIRCVGDPSERFSEDALRVMRALRFAAQLGFSVEERTWEAVKSHASDLKKISIERVRDEMMKTISSPHPELWTRAYEAGITAVFLPEFDVCMKTEQNTPFHIYSVGEHIVHSMQAIEPDPVLRLAMLLHDIAKPLVHYKDSTGRDHFKGHAGAGAEKAEEILRRLKFDNETIRQVTRLIRYHDLRPKRSDAEVRRAVAQIGPDLFEDYLKMQMADAMAKNPEYNAGSIERIRGTEKIYREIIARGDCLTVADLKINGQDLIDAGMKPGKNIGYILESALLAVLEEPSLNDHDLLMMYALQMM